MKTPEERKEYQRQYYEKNKVRFAKQHHAYYLKNREAIIIRTQAWALNRKPERARIVRKHRYGTDGMAAWESQNGLCGICETDLSALSTRCQHLDHCHKTGKIRGWLCHRCNTAIGKLGDSAEGVRRALVYLTR